CKARDHWGRTHSTGRKAYPGPLLPGADVQPLPPDCGVKPLDVDVLIRRSIEQHAWKDARGALHGDVPEGRPRAQLGGLYVEPRPGQRAVAVNLINIFQGKAAHERGDGRLLSAPGTVEIHPAPLLSRIHVEPVPVDCPGGPALYVDIFVR